MKLKLKTYFFTSLPLLSSSTQGVIYPSNDFSESEIHFKRSQSLWLDFVSAKKYSVPFSSCGLGVTGILITCTDCYGHQSSLNNWIVMTSLTNPKYEIVTLSFIKSYIKRWCGQCNLNSAGFAQDVKKYQFNMKNGQWQVWPPIMHHQFKAQYVNKEKPCVCTYVCLYLSVFGEQRKLD